MEEKLLYTVAEASKLLRMSRNTIYSLINEGQLKCLNLGHKKIPAAELQRFLEENTISMAEH